MKTPFQRFALAGIVFAVMFLAGVCYIFVRSYDEQYTTSVFSRIVHWLQTAFPYHANEI